ncbi:hypothetical protein RF657_03205 [Yersinia rochesterensis]|uniref:hypothetical protein n=1 Tax=Yersinia rochesterensis TaxID=1604335 RepID=UPI0028533A58|nr:hypothetical protein [Yersinia rochesterensis]MDR5017415.1 hypothetical protein [Yersinia rochesterensis]
MNAISYPLVTEAISKIFNNNKANDNEIIQFKIDEEQIFFDKEEGISEIIHRLCQKEWVNSTDNTEDTELYNLLNNLTKKSLPEVILGFDGVIRHSLPIDNDTVFRFEGNALSGVKVHYSVVQRDGECNLFKLNCEFSFGKDCSLAHEKPNISIEYYPQCSESIKQALDPRTVMQKILDWIKNLFQSDIYIACNDEFISNVEKNIIVRVLEKTELAVDNGEEIEKMLENLSKKIQSDISNGAKEFEYNNTELEWDYEPK